MTEQECKEWRKLAQELLDEARDNELRTICRLLAAVVGLRNQKKVDKDK